MLKKKHDNIFEDGLPSKHQLRKQINSLLNENEILKEVIKSELYKEFINNLGEPERIKKLNEENKRLRLKLKSLKEEKTNGNRPKRKK